jgi:hypothetical protein
MRRRGQKATPPISIHSAQFALAPQGPGTQPTAFAAGIRIYFFTKVL